MYSHVFITGTYLYIDSEGFGYYLSNGHHTIESFLNLAFDTQPYLARNSSNSTVAILTHSLYKSCMIFQVIVLELFHHFPNSGSSLGLATMSNAAVNVLIQVFP